MRVIPRDELPIFLRVYYADLTARMLKDAADRGETEWQLLQLERRLDKGLDALLKKMCPRH